ARMAPQQGGLLVALDGWAPPGGEPHRWCIRALSSGLTVRSGWRCQPDQPTGAACLAPRKHLAWPVLAGRSDTHTGVVPAVAPGVPHPRSLRPRKGRPPLRRAGREPSERRQNGARLRRALLATRAEARLAPWSHGLQAALAPGAPPSQACRHGAAWLRDIASSCDP